MENKINRKPGSAKAEPGSVSALRGGLLVILAGIGWGIIGIFTRKLTAAGLNSFQIIFVRGLLTALMLAAVMAVRSPGLFRIRVRDLWMFVGCGLLSIVFFNVCYFMTIEASTLSAAAVLLYTAPCFVILFSAVLFHEKITGRKITALLLAFSGCALTAGIAGGNAGLTAFSVLTGIGSGVGFALYSIFSKLALQRYSAVTTTFWTYLSVTVGLLPFSQPHQILEITEQDPVLILDLVLIALVCTLLPSTLYTKALTMMEAGRASVIAFVEPLTATVTGIACFGEQLTFQSAAGIALIFIALIVLNTGAADQTGSARSGQEQDHDSQTEGSPGFRKPDDHIKLREQ